MSAMSPRELSVEVSGNGLRQYLATGLIALGVDGSAMPALLDAVDDGVVRSIVVRTIDSAGVVIAELTVRIGARDERGIAGAFQTTLLKYLIEFAGRPGTTVDCDVILAENAPDDSALRSAYGLVRAGGRPHHTAHLPAGSRVGARVAGGAGWSVDADSPAVAEIEVAAYLDTEDERVAGRVFDALDDLVRTLGYGDPESVRVRRGSIFRRSKAVASRVLGSREFRDRLTKVERALELVTLDAKQAEVDGKEAEAVAKLVATLADVPHACIRVGSILLVKYTEPAGPVLITRNLSQPEIAALEKFPEIQRKPRLVLDALATALGAMGELSANDARR